MVVGKKDIEHWQSQSIEELEALLQHNDNIIQDHTQQVNNVKNCNTKIEEILKHKREKRVKQKLQEEKEKLEIVLSLMEHTQVCQEYKKANNYNASWVTPGVYENGRCYCPKCTLQYLVDNPWAGFGFRITAEFDMDGDGFYDSCD